MLVTPTYFGIPFVCFMMFVDVKIADITEYIP